MSTLDDIRQTFFQECDDLLEALDDGLQELSDSIEDGNKGDSEVVNAVFRAVHSIKGGAAAFGLETLVRFAHCFETTLDEIRSEKLELDSDILQVCLRAADQLANLVAAGREGREVSAESISQVSSRLEALSGKTSKVEHVEPETEGSDNLEYAPVALDFNLSGQPDDHEVERTYSIKFIALNSLFQNGHDPVHLFRELSEIGELRVISDTSKINDFNDLDPSECSIGWLIELKTNSSLDEVSEIFEFVQGLCELSIDETAQEASELPPGIEDQQTSSPENSEDRFKKNDDIEQSKEDLAERRSDRPSTSGSKATVRVDLDHVDRLINVVGELVINQAVLNQCIQAANIAPTSALTASLDEFMVLAREIQEGVMSIRAQSVKPLFQRMARIAREAGELAGKSVKFVTEGEATEVDKTVIERLVDPLTHIIRNSVDHGLESAEKRVAKGKPDVGTVTLRAAHRSGRVLIDVADDGGGIDREKVLSIAKSKNLIDPDATPTDAEIDKLLFLPGFSTATTVTDLSGRGVGMDVVRSSIQKLGGRISIASVSGVGTTMSISLPLTLAVLDGMVVDVAGQTMVVPITTIIETIRPTAADVHALGGDMRVISVRNNFIPIIDLGLVFGFRSDKRDPSEMVFLLVESDHEKMWALAVDRIHDQRQVVIKGLESNYGHIPGIAAATILGDGKVALIVDPEEAALRSPQDPNPEIILSEEEVKP